MEGNGAAVLIIENNESLSKALVNVLAAQGFKTLIANDFDSAAELFDAERPALVLSELKIGEEAAFNFLKKSRASKQNPGVPIILMSSSKNPKIITAAAKAGASDFVVKPFSPEILAEKIDKAMSRRSKRPASAEAEKFVAAGKQCIEEKRLKDAMTLFAKAAKIDPECAEAFSGLSRVCRIKKDMDQYEKLALKAAELHARHDNFEAARGIFHEVKQHDPEAPNPFKLVARDMAEQGDLEGSVKSYQKAALADPEDTEVYSDLAQTYIKMGNVGKAEQSLVAGLRINEDNAEARKLFRGITGKRWSEHPESKAGKERIAEEERKGTVRFWIPDLLAEVKGHGEHPSLIEMSVNSIGFSPLEEPFKEGELLSLTILRIEEGQPNRLIKKLKARVAGQDAEVVSCRFEDLSEEQRQELMDLIKSAQEAQRELKREEMLKKGEVNFDLDMLFL